MTADSLHVHNARIWTGDPQRPWARTISINAGRISSIDQPASNASASINAEARTIVPGLIDSHLHLLTAGATLTRLDLSSVRSRTEFERAIAQRHAELPPGQWLIANGWSQENWSGGAAPDKSWLSVAQDRPIVCYRMDMHVALVNDAVLKMCDLKSDPPGGRIVRDQPTGLPTGLMIEAAAWELVNPLVPKPSLPERQEHLRAAQRHVHALGITTVGSMEYARDVQDLYLPLRDELTLRCRITLLDRDWPMDFSFGRSIANDCHFAIIGYKAFIDGTLGSRTARMLRDYADDPGNRGMLVELARDGRLHDWARAVAANGFSPSMHAIGDEAARLALDVIDGIDSERRPRIEHAQQLDLADIPRFRGRIASMQPLHKADDCRYVQKRLGSERLAGTFAFRTLADAGAILAFGSDWPVVSPDPLLGIRTAVTGLLVDGTRFGEQENLTVEEALRAYTGGAAYALGMDDAGILRPGALGDLVMFDRDPFEADWEQQPPRVAMTIVGGTVVYDVTASQRA